MRLTVSSDTRAAPACRPPAERRAVGVAGVAVARQRTCRSSVPTRSASGPVDTKPTRTGSTTSYPRQKRVGRCGRRLQQIRQRRHRSVVQVRRRAATGRRAEAARSRWCCGTPRSPRRGLRRTRCRRRPTPWSTCPAGADRSRLRPRARSCRPAGRSAHGTRRIAPGRSRIPAAASAASTGSGNRGAELDSMKFVMRCRLDIEPASASSHFATSRSTHCARRAVAERRRKHHLAQRRAQPVPVVGPALAPAHVPHAAPCRCCRWWRRSAVRASGTSRG